MLYTVVPLPVCAIVHLADVIHLHVTGTSTETGMLPRSLDVLFNSIEGRQWDNMALKPSMFCAVTKLSPEQEQLQHQIKESVLKLASDDVVSDSHFSLSLALSLSLSLSHFSLTSLSLSTSPILFPPSLWSLQIVFCGRLEYKDYSMIRSLQCFYSTTHISVQCADDAI